MLHLGIDPFTATAVGGLLEAFGAKGGHEVLHADHLPAEPLIDERAVGEGQEDAIGVHLAELDKVALTHQGLASGVDVNVRAKLLALADDGIDFLQAQIQLVAVLAGPATRAMQVAGAGGIEQDGPWDVALVLIAVGLLDRPCHKVAIDDKRLDKAIAHLWVQVVHDVHQQLVPVALLIDGAAKCRTLACEQVCRGGLVQQIHDLHDVVLWIGKEIIHCLFVRRPFDMLGRFHYPYSPR